MPTLSMSKDLNRGSALTFREPTATVSWEAKPPKSLMAKAKAKAGLAKIDLDGGAVLFEGPTPVRICYPTNPRPFGPRTTIALHHGDVTNPTKANDGVAEEKLSFELDNMPDNITALVFFATAWGKKSKIQDAQNVTLRIEEPGADSATAMPSLLDNGNTMIISMMKRTGTGWEGFTIGQMATVHNEHGLLTMAQDLVSR